MAKYTKHKSFRLKGHAEFTERWLQDQIAKDPEILGLGELVLLGRERRLDKAGRLDLLLADPDEGRRYEVELQLGQTDESHIIRTIEYWDVERRRYPQYDHCAVLVAEDITSRFLNVLNLFIGHIPLIVIQLNALEVGDHIVLDFVRVIDRFTLREDVKVESILAKTDRDYWERTATPTTVELADKCLAIINGAAGKELELTYNKFYLGLQEGGRSTMFVHFRPRKTFLQVNAAVNDLEHWKSYFVDQGVEAEIKEGSVRASVAPKDFEKQKLLFTELLKAAVKDYYED